MQMVIQNAQETFKYFWRELSWEYRRIVPALDLYAVKKAFTQQTDDPENPIEEYLWLNEIQFDGEQIEGVLMNSPYELTNVKEGDVVTFALTELIDWLLVSGDQVCGGFSIQYFRSQMDEAERKQHDEQWGIDFGDFNDIAVVLGQKECPENLIEHPMSINMKERMAQYLQGEQKEALFAVDEQGYSILHREAIAGNKTMVEVLLKEGMDKHLKTPSGKTALDFARQLDWVDIVIKLENSQS